MPSSTTPPPAPGASEPISLRETARRLGVHYMTAYRYVRTGRLPARQVGQEWLIDPADLARLREPAAAEPGRRARRDRVPILIDRMTAGDEAGAWRVIDEALTGGQDATGVYLDLLVPALRGVGEAWAAGSVSVAGEHRASAIAQRIIGRLGPRFARRGRKRGTVVLGGPAGEQHSLPGALISDLLRGRGFDVIDLGANTPAGSFAETAGQAGQLVAVIIGVTAPGLDDSVRAAVAALRAAAVSAPVLAGGAAVTSTEHARALGADAWTGPDGRAALATVDRLAGPRAATRTTAQAAQSATQSAAQSAARAGGDRPSATDAVSGPA
ncbi:MAG: B12-binding domain-containing protein [Actinobacteria bacterium]|nr:B12-binding domain-containing protein [Actinomycetota bacterium]